MSKRNWSKFTLFAVFIACAILFSFCNNDSPSGKRDSATSDTSVSDSLRSTSKVPTIESRLSGPMLGLANYLDSLGYVEDSTRLESVYSYLKNNPCMYRGGHTFYQCERSETFVNDLIIIGNLPRTFDTLIFPNQESVIEYFFTTPAKDESGWFTDGIVEQWKFEDSAQAITAAEAIALDSNVSVHNAPLMVCCIDEYMYVFYSRATPSVYKMKPYFINFVKQNDARIISRMDW